jgi:hypothetical protein
MIRGRITTLVVTALAVLAVPASSVAATGAPRAGKWKTSNGGHFTVSGDQKSVSGLHISGTSCGLKNLAVAGKQKLHLSTQAGISNWIVGTTDPTRKNPKDLHGLVGQKVTIHSGPQTLQGRLDMVYAVGGTAGQNSGDLLVKGCDLFFTITP